MFFIIWIWNSWLTGEHWSQKDSFLQSPYSFKLGWYSHNKEKVSISRPKSMNFLPCFDSGKELLSRPSILHRGLSILTIFITCPALQPLLQYHAMISKCTDVKETCQCLEVKSQNIITCHTESIVIKTGIQVWRNKRSQTLQRPGQGSSVRRPTGQLWCVSVKEGGAPSALNVSPIESPGCLPRVYAYCRPLMKASLHSFELTPAKEALQEQKHCCDVRSHNC